MVMQQDEVSTTDTTASASSRSEILRWRRERCIAALNKLVPDTDSTRSGVWSKESIRTLTAIFEIQRLELYSEIGAEHIHHSLIAKVIMGLATISYFPDDRSEGLVLEMEAHLRLLAAALRTYQYHAKSLDHDRHQSVYDGITKLSSTFKANSKNRDQKQLVEDRNVAFLVKHCQYLLVAIQDSETLGRQIARKAVVGVDGALAGLGSQYQDIRPAIQTILKRQRRRGKWHEEYTGLEDLCWSVFASDIRMRGQGQDENVEAFVQDAELATSQLRESFEEVLGERKPENLLKRTMRKVIGTAAEVMQEAGPADEHSDYLLYGILYLLYQLSFRIRKRARKSCFKEYVKVVRMVFESCSPSVAGLHLKAFDLWNRLKILGAKDNTTYGDVLDCEAVRKAIKSRREIPKEELANSEA